MLFFLLSLLRTVTIGSVAGFFRKSAPEVQAAESNGAESDIFVGQMRDLDAEDYSVEPEETDDSGRDHNVASPDEHDTDESQDHDVHKMTEDEMPDHDAGHVAGTDKQNIDDLDSSEDGPDPSQDLDTSQDEHAASSKHDHSGHDPVAEAEVAQPAKDIAAFIDQVRKAPESHVHDANTELASEHEAAMDLVPRDMATHIAIGNGSWFDPGNWHNGEVPGDDARVLIPETIEMTYDGISDARIFTVRVDGELDFATDTHSKMVVDTFVVSPSGVLTIGTEDTPVEADVKVEIIIANNGAIDTDWDPHLLSRGLIAHGKTIIQGAEKDSHEKVVEDPLAGDTSVVFEDIPTGWAVGDTIVIAGTHYEGYNWDNDASATIHHESEDEVRVITRIEGNEVFFDNPLEHDHDAPRDDLKTSVANYTRNVSIETENHEDAEDYERGHVMFMHSDDVEVRYAEFTGLGRTDKSEDSFQVSDFETVDFDTNVQGRYSLHLHRTGVDELTDPAILEGNAVYGSPGWGIVQHDANAIVTNNATFDTFGAGYVAETGNETGAWTDNIAIYAQGTSWFGPKATSEYDADTFDTARGGHGFWFQGRMISTEDNVAASVNRGYVYFHRDGDDRMINIEAENFDFPDALYYRDVTADDTPIINFDGNETFASMEGFHVVKSNPNQGHDIWSKISDFTAWNVFSGMHLEYTAHYLIENADLVAAEDIQFSPSESGISTYNNTAELVIVDSNIEGFTTGIDLFKDWVNMDGTPEDHNFIVVDAKISGETYKYENYDTKLDMIIDSNTLSDNPTIGIELDTDQLTYKEGALDPDARTIEISGTKHDSLGAVEYPGGIDTFNLRHHDVARLLEEDGYFTTSDEQDYFLLNLYMTDRLTGEIFYETHSVLIDENVKLGEPIYHGGWYAGAKFNGVQDFSTMADGTVMAGDQVLDTPIAVARSGADDFIAAAEKASLNEMIGIDGLVDDETMHLHHEHFDDAMAHVDLM